MKVPVKASLLPAILATTSFPLYSTVPEKTPNILVILVDDLGYGDLSCQEVATDLYTPAIDKLLNEGIRCTNFYANSPVSSPSRASLLTGCFPDRVGVPGVIRTHAEDSWGYLSPEAVLLPQLLKEKSYHTALIGKWHLGLESPNTPRERGFDYFYGFLGDMMDDYYTHLRWGNNYMRKNEEVINPEGHATELFSDWAIEYVTDRKRSEQPFFLYLAYNAPHVPVQPPAEWLEKVREREPGLDETRMKLVAFIEHMDYEIGRVYKALEQNGQLENTLIIFASDNGGEAGAGANNLPFRGAKQFMFEGGIHVPGGFYWKNTIQPAVRDNIVILSDILPTLCDLLHIPVRDTVDGISILPVLEGKEQDTANRQIHWVRREGNLGYGGRAYYASRLGDYKILQNTPWEPLQLFNLKEDPQESFPVTDLSSPVYQTLFEGLMDHIRRSGSIPWQAPQN